MVDINKILEFIRNLAMTQNDKLSIEIEKSPDVKKKGWWKRYVERLSKSIGKLQSDCGN